MKIIFKLQFLLFFEHMCILYFQFIRFNWLNKVYKKEKIKEKHRVIEGILLLGNN